MEVSELLAAASVSSIGYASSNALNTETYGNSLIHGVSYNNRLQPTEIRLGTSSNSTSVIDLTYSYGTTANNGDVLSASYSGGGLSYTQSFGYDSLNRLTTSVESGSSWSQTNGYDQYGNRWIDYGGGSHNLAFSTSTNRITTTGFSYDSNGNLTNDTVHAYTFDAENKILKVDSTTAYAYDGEGHRVRKYVGENTRFVYGIDGQLVAEFDGSSGNLKKEYVYGGATLVTIEPTAVNSNGTQYTTSDNLGSPRVITNSSAGIVSRHDYMPFGEELGAGTGGRTTGMGFSNNGDNNRKKFTGYERDTETGLDFAQARYYSNTQGRFSSPDPFAGSATIGNPQTFNRYVYCGNNPVNSRDPLGMVAQPGGRNISNWNGASAAAEATDGISPWPDSTDAGAGQRQQPAAPPPSTQPPPVNVPEPQDWPPPTPPWLSGPIPLPPGIAPVPTALVPIEGPNQTYNGNSEISPTGTVVNSGPNYGQARVVDYLILDQGGNPMGPQTRVTWTEVLRSPDPGIQQMITNGTIRPSQFVSPEQNGTVEDTLGFISNNPATSQTAATTRPFTIVQDVTISMPDANNRPQGVLHMHNTISISPNGVAVRFGPVTHF